MQTGTNHLVFGSPFSHFFSSDKWLLIVYFAYPGTCLLWPQEGKKKQATTYVKIYDILNLANPFQGHCANSEWTVNTPTPNFHLWFVSIFINLSNCLCFSKKKRRQTEAVQETTGWLIATCYCGQVSRNLFDVGIESFNGLVGCFCVWIRSFYNLEEWFGFADFNSECA